jgi:hypothetical protein
MDRISNDADAWWLTALDNAICKELEKVWRSRDDTLTDDDIQRMFYEYTYGLMPEHKGIEVVAYERARRAPFHERDLETQKRIVQHYLAEDDLYLPFEEYLTDSDAAEFKRRIKETVAAHILSARTGEDLDRIMNESIAPDVESKYAMSWTSGPVDRQKHEPYYYMAYGRDATHLRNLTSFELRRMLEGGELRSRRNHDEDVDSLCHSLMMTMM